MARQEAEWSNRLSIFWLKKHRYLDGGWRSGGIKWTYGLSGNESSIGFDVYTNWREWEDTSNWTNEELKEYEERTVKENYIRLHYTHTDRLSGEKESMNNRVELTTTTCNYGGKRYWFICPLIKNGKYCGRRVGVLFSIGKWFGCRHCGEIAYAAQMKGGKFRGSSVSYPDIERLEKEIKRYYYNGKPTRKYRRLVRMEQKMNNDLFRIAAKSDDKFERFIK